MPHPRVGAAVRAPDHVAPLSPSCWPLFSNGASVASQEGCRPLMYALLAPGLPNGAYIADCELRDISPPSKSVAARTDLWEWTEAWVERTLGAMAEPAPAQGGELTAQCASDE